MNVSTLTVPVRISLRVNGVRMSWWRARLLIAIARLLGVPLKGKAE